MEISMHIFFYSNFEYFKCVCYSMIACKIKCLYLYACTMYMCEYTCVNVWMYMCEYQRFNQKYVLRSCFGAFHLCIVLFTFFLLFCIMQPVFCIICLVSFVLSTVIFAFYVLCYLLCDLSFWKCLLADRYGLPIRD